MSHPEGTDLDLPRIIEDQKECLAPLKIIGELREPRTQESQIPPRVLLRTIGEVIEPKKQEPITLLRALLRAIGEMREPKNQESQTLLRAIGEPMRGRILLMSAESLGIGIGTRERILLQKLTLL